MSKQRKVPNPTSCMVALVLQEAYPKYLTSGQIAEKTGTHIYNVNRYIRELEDGGHILVKKHVGYQFEIKAKSESILAEYVGSFLIY